MTLSLYRSSNFSIFNFAQHSVRNADTGRACFSFEINPIDLAILDSNVFMCKLNFNFESIFFTQSCKAVIELLKLISMLQILFVVSEAITENDNFR